VRISTEVAARNPDAFGGKWLLSVLPRADGVSPVALDRVSALLRRFCGDQALAPAVDTVFEELLRTQAFAEAVGLAERLIGESGFGALPWLRRIVDSGDAVVCAAVQRLLGHQLAEGTRVYPLLQALAAWLPPTESGRRTYSRSSVLALAVLPEFAMSAASCLDVAEYGGWPSPYALFGSLRRENLPEQVNLVMSWLLHPALYLVFGEGEAAEAEADRIVATLIAEWTFILCGDTGLKPGGGAAGLVNLDPPSPLTAADVLIALLGAFRTQTQNRGDYRMREVCVMHWTEMSRASAELIPVLGRTAGPVRDQIIWKHHLLRALASGGLSGWI
jgi:hypothetical protein